METITINKQNALKAYNGAKGEIKQALADLFGQEVTSQKITDRIQGWGDAAAIMGFNPVSDLPYPNASTERQHAVNAFFVIDVAVDAYNEGKVADWDDKTQKKFQSWWQKNASSFGFSYSYSYYDYSRSVVGLRLSLLSEEHWPDIAKKFDTWFQKLLTKTENKKNGN